MRLFINHALRLAAIIFIVFTMSVGVVIPQSVVYAQDGAPADSPPPPGGAMDSGGGGDFASADDGGGDTAPVDDGGGDAAPTDDDGGEPAPVDDGGGDTAPTDDGGGERAPVDDGGGDAAPVDDDGGDTATADGGGDSTPDEESSEDALESGSEAEETPEVGEVAGSEGEPTAEPTNEPQEPECDPTTEDCSSEEPVNGSTPEAEETTEVTCNPEIEECGSSTETAEPVPQETETPPLASSSSGGGGSSPSSSEEEEEPVEETEEVVQVESTPEPTEEPTEEPVEENAQPEDTATPAAEDTEKETIISGVAELNEADAVLLDEHGEPLPMASKETADILSSLPTDFIPNVGQAGSPDEVAFYVESLGGKVYFTDEGVTFKMPVWGTNEEDGTPVIIEENVFQLQFENPNQALSIEGGDPSGGTANIYQGNDATQWVTGLETYDNIFYRNIYDGIDLLYETRNGFLKSTYVVSAGADPNSIQWSYDGLTAYAIDPDTGELVMNLVTENEDKTITDQAPVVWQEIEGEKYFVDASYHLGEDNLLSYTLGDYNLGHSLFIDPLSTSYATYIGGSGDDYGVGGQGINRDAAGNIYVTGTTTSNDYPTTNGSSNSGNYDLVVSKFDPGGNLLHSTYIGGSASDYAYGGHVDDNGNMYLVGDTVSADLPMLNSYDSTFNYSGAYGTRGDAFLVRIGSDGLLDYSTYFGGVDTDRARSVAADNAGNAYIVGESHNGSALPMVNAWDPARNNDDGFLAKFNTNASGAGSLIYSTFIGGNDRESTMSVALDSAGNPYTLSSAVAASNYAMINAQDPTYNGGAHDTVIHHFNASGTADYASYLGGAGDDSGGTVKVDANDNLLALIATDSGSGLTFSGNAFDTTHNGGVDSYLAVFNGSHVLQYATLFGGSGNDYLNGVVVAADGSMTLVGSTSSPNLPVTGNALQSTLNGSSDAFLARLKPSGDELTFMTYYGGNGTDGIGAIAEYNGGMDMLVYGSTGGGLAIPGGAYDDTHNGAADLYYSIIHFQTNAPTDIYRDTDDFSDGQPAGTLVANLSAEDLDIPFGDSFTYALVAGSGDSDNALFQIVGGQLQFAVGGLVLDRDYTIRIQVTDIDGLTYETTLTWSPSPAVPPAAPPPESPPEEDPAPAPPTSPVYSAPPPVEDETLQMPTFLMPAKKAEALDLKSPVTLPNIVEAAPPKPDVTLAQPPKISVARRSIEIPYVVWPYLIISGVGLVYASYSLFSKEDKEWAKVADLIIDISDIRTNSNNS